MFAGAWHKRRAQRERGRRLRRQQQEAAGADGVRGSPGNGQRHRRADQAGGELLRRVEGEIFFISARAGPRRSSPNARAQRPRVN